MSRDCTISVVIPTYKRPDGIRCALGSVEHCGVEGYDVEIVIADNDPAGSARDFVESFAAQSPAKILYVHVPQPGVSNARNGALTAASGRYIAFLDDDMEAQENWLPPLLAMAKQTGAAAVFGPVEAVMPDTNNPTYRYMQPLFSRKPDYADGEIDWGIATGNSFIDRDQIALPCPAFDPALNQTGGEDDKLFRYLKTQGGRFAWASGAGTYEHVPAKRATMRYVWQRNFAWGQGPTQDCADRGLAGLLGIAKWTVIGSLQIAGYGLLFLALRLLGRPKYVFYWGRLAQGVGKIFWGDRFSPRLYGV